MHRREDAALFAAGWIFQDHDALNLDAARRVAMRHFPMALLVSGISRGKNCLAMHIHLASLLRAVSCALLVAMPSCCPHAKNPTGGPTPPIGSPPADAKDHDSMAKLPNANNLKATSKDCTMWCNAALENHNTPKKINELKRMCAGDESFPDVCNGCPQLQGICGSHGLEYIEPADSNIYFKDRADELLNRIIPCFAGAHTRRTYLDAEKEILGDPSENWSAVVEYREKVKKEKCKK